MAALCRLSQQLLRLALFLLHENMKLPLTCWPCAPMTQTTCESRLTAQAVADPDPLFRRPGLLSNQECARRSLAGTAWHSWLLRPFFGRASRLSMSALAGVRGRLIEAYAAYRQRMGQWRQDVYTMAGTPLFWVALRVFHYCHAPIDHLQHFLQSTKDPHIASLTCGKAAEIARQFQDVLLRTTWEAMADKLPIRQHKEVFFLAVGLVLNLSAGFNRRVARPLSRRRPRRLLTQTVRQAISKTSALDRKWPEH